MSLERKDVRFKLDPDDHAALSALADLADAELGEFVELIVVRELARRIHAARLVAERTSGWGGSGKFGGAAGIGLEHMP